MTGPDLHEASRLVGEDIAFQRRTWHVQRIGWVVMAGIVALGLLGAFGGGPIASATARPEGGGFTLTWERIMRSGTENRMTIATDAPTDGDLDVRVEGDLAESLELVMADPQPVRSTRSPGRLDLTMPAPRGRPAEVILRLRTHGPGLLSGRVTVAGAAVPTRVLVLP